MNLAERADIGSAVETTAVERSPERLDVVVIGAGQAGLALGYFLARQGRRFLLLDGADSIGASWRRRWDSLVLFTPRRYDVLPGEADQVVVATGPFQMPHVPALARELAPDVFQTHSDGYRRPSDVPAGNVLVVGGGNTGYQIAHELSATHPVHLSVGSRQTPLPQRFLGRDLFWWLTKTGLLEKTVDSRLGRRMRHRDTLIGSSPRRLRRSGVDLRPRAVGASSRTISFADGSELAVDAVIWATGYRPDHSWIGVPVLDSEGRVDHRRGVTDVPGLYFLGLSWQHTRGSALLGWVETDAEFVAEQIDAFAIGQLGREDETEHDESVRAPRPTPLTEGV